jgi:hypothetical protein
VPTQPSRSSRWAAWSPLPQLSLSPTSLGRHIDGSATATSLCLYLLLQPVPDSCPRVPPPRFDPPVRRSQHQPSTAQPTPTPRARAALHDHLHQPGSSSRPPVPASVAHYFPRCVLFSVFIRVAGRGCRLRGLGTASCPEIALRRARGVPVCAGGFVICADSCQSNAAQFHGRV